ncbi:39S ribosomal protein L51, mitochondrial [Thelotrema lepadinum]|nr:39S ribosomal protein L51, mitochondrial [Thelotrema lepadinum]
MPVAALEAVSTGRNGVGTFIHQCKRLDFHFCDWAGSSRGMNAFLTTHLPPLATSSASITFHVSPRPHAHPLIRGHYVNGATKSICVRNLSPSEILKKALLLRDSSGEKNRRVKGGRVVRSLNESVRGVWSAVHAVGKGVLEGKGEGDVWGFRAKEGGGEVVVGRGGKKRGAGRREEELGLVGGVEGEGVEGRR